MKYKTSELTGALLDAAVTKAEGDMDCDLRGLPRAVMIHRGSDSRIYAPSTDWRDGGPIVEREGICVRGQSGMWFAYLSDALPGDDPSDGSGSTYLVAAMRAYVASKLGDEVELP